MNSSERVIAALERRKVDLVAVALSCGGPNSAIEALLRTVDYYYELYDAALEAAEGGIRMIGFGDDLATRRDLLLSPDMWRDFCKEAMSRLFSLGKKHGVYVFFHSCGAVRSIIPDLIEIGLDILFPIQPNAPGMDHRGLKVDFGERLAFFWGGG